MDLYVSPLRRPGRLCVLSELNLEMLYVDRRVCTQFEAEDTDVSLEYLPESLDSFLRQPLLTRLVHSIVELQLNLGPRVVAELLG